MTDGDGIFGLNPLRDLLIDMPDITITALEKVVDEFQTKYSLEPLLQVTVSQEDSVFRLSALRFISKHLYPSNPLNKDNSLTLDFSSIESSIAPIKRLKTAIVKIKAGKIYDRRSYKDIPNVDLFSLIPNPTSKKYRSLSKIIKLFEKNYVVNNYLLAACITPYHRKNNGELTKYTKKDYQNNKLRDDKRIKARIRRLNEYLKGEYCISFNYDCCALKPQNSI